MQIFRESVSFLHKIPADSWKSGLNHGNWTLISSFEQEEAAWKLLSRYVPNYISYRQVIEKDSSKGIFIKNQFQLEEKQSGLILWTVEEQFAGYID